MNPKNSEKIQQATENALEYERIVKERISRSPQFPVAGNIYCLLIGAEHGINWAVLYRHKDDPNLWFVVPHDMNPQVGTWDVQRTDQVYVLRCGCGTWVATEQLPHSGLMDFLNEKDLAEARKKMAVMVGSDIAVDSHPEIDCDPDYEEWNATCLSVAHSLGETPTC